MARCTWRVRHVIGGVALLFAIAVLAPALALAVPGDSAENAVSARVGATISATLVPSDDDETHYVYESKLYLRKGQTVVATYSCDPSVTQPDFSWWTAFKTDDWLGADVVSPTQQVSWLLAPKNGTYFLAVGGSASGTVTVETTLTSAIEHTCTKVQVASVVRKNKYLKISTTLVGEFDELTIPVRFEIQKKNKKGVYSAVMTVKPGFAEGGDSQHVPLYRNVKFVKSGSYRVRPTFSDAAHPTVRRFGWKTFRVK